MRYLLLAGTAFLTGCANQSTPYNGWMNNCNHYSYDSRELALCKERVMKQQPAQAGAGQVTLNPGSADAPSEESLHKNKD